MDGVLDALRGRTAAVYAVSPLYRFGLDPRSRKLYADDVRNCASAQLGCPVDKVRCTVSYERAEQIDADSALPASCVVIDLVSPSPVGREQRHTFALFARASDYDPANTAFFPCKLALCRAPRAMTGVVFQWLERRFDARSSLAPLRLNPRTLYDLSAAAMPDLADAAESSDRRRGRLSRLRHSTEFRFALPASVAARGLASITCAVPADDMKRAVAAVGGAAEASPAAVVRTYFKQHFKISIDCARLVRASCALWIADVSAVKVLQNAGWRSLLPALFAVAHPEVTAAIESSAQVPVVVPSREEARDAARKKSGRDDSDDEAGQDSPPSRVAVATPRRNPKRRPSVAAEGAAAARRRLE